MKITCAIFVFMGLFTINSFAQDIHFTQFYNAPVYLHPARTGAYNGDMRIIANYRQQWTSVPVPYRRIHTSFDQKIRLRTLPEQQFAAGISLLQDQAGDSRLSHTSLLISGAYFRPLNSQNIISVGVQLGAGQRRLRTDALTFDAQYDGYAFDATVNTGENLPAESLIYGDIGAGINWHFKASETGITTDVAVSLAHINRPRQSFFRENNIDLSRRINISGKANISLNAPWSIQPALQIQYQKPYIESIIGTNISYEFSEAKTENTAVFVGGWWRIGDALATSAGIDYDNWKLGISYDFNTSAFNAATNGNGGFELSLVYIIHKVEVTNAIKSCPIF